MIRDCTIAASSPKESVGVVAYAAEHHYTRSLSGNSLPTELAANHRRPFPELLALLFGERSIGLAQLGRRLMTEEHVPCGVDQPLAFHLRGPLLERAGGLYSAVGHRIEQVGDEQFIRGHRTDLREARAAREDPAEPSST